MTVCNHYSPMALIIFFHDLIVTMNMWNINTIVTNKGNGVNQSNTGELG